jgi:hypothetical protein
MDPTIALLTLLTALLLPWMAWLSKILVSIQIRLARGEENFDRVNNILNDHETRLRNLETSGYH